MLKRLWFLLATLWALAFIGNGMTKVDGPQPMDLWIALSPIALGWFLTRAARFVVTGSPLKQKTRVYR